MIENTISVIIINHKRILNLFNTLRGLEKGKVTPDEIVLIEMDEERTELPIYNLNITHHLISDFDNNALPIAKARNLGAEIATHNFLVFLDVDCIPSEDYIYNIKKIDLGNSTVYMGQPKYLLNRIIYKEKVDLETISVFHPHRMRVYSLTQSEDYGMFWSLCFFLRKDLFYELGGFDEDYKGYGAEDTDFAFKIRQRSYLFCLTPFIVYHQQHKFVSPPLNNLKAIVDNSNRFWKKWKIWPMDNHLDKFKEMGYIDWNKAINRQIRILKLPDNKAIEAYTVYDEPYA